MLKSESMIITIEVVSCIFMIVILCGSIFGNAGKERATVAYRCCLIATIIGSALDAISYLTDGRTEWKIFLIFINMFTYILWVLFILLFAWYTISVIEKRVVVSEWVIVPIAVATSIGILACLIGSFNGKLLYIEDGYFYEGPWGNLLSVFLCACMIYMYAVLFFYRKALGRSEMAVLAAFMLFPFVDTILSVYLEIDYSFPILAVAFLVIYVVIQERTIAEDRIRKKIYEENSYTDPLTRSKNLRAYDDLIKADVHGKAKGIVNFELESYTAEEVGVFASEIRGCFEGADIFRLSENEFTVLVYKMSKAAFEKKVDQIKETLNEDGIKASVVLEVKWDQ